MPRGNPRVVVQPHTPAVRPAATRTRVVIRWRRLEDAATIAVLALACVVFFFPILLVVTTSFKAPADILAAPPHWIFRPTLANYKALVGLQPSQFHIDLFLHFRSSVLAAGGATLCSLVLGVPAAYAFARLRFRGNLSLLLSLLALRMLPPIAIVIPLYLIMRSLRLLDTVSGLIVAYTTFNLPFVIWMMRGFFLDLPADLEEAAWIDGATRGQAFLKIMLPLSAPGLVASAIFALMLAWNDFLFAVILTSRTAPTLPMLVAGFITEEGVSWGIMMASGTIIVVPMLLFTLFVQRYFAAGLSTGAIKG